MLRIANTYSQFADWHIIRRWASYNMPPEAELILNVLKVFGLSAVTFFAALLWTPLLTHYLYKYRLWRKSARTEARGGGGAPPFSPPPQGGANTPPPPGRAP